MTRESSPSKGWREVAKEMGVEAGMGSVDDFIDETADRVEAEGFDELADRLRNAAERGREVSQ